MSSQVHANHLLKIENNININPKSFWNYIKSLRSYCFNNPLSVYLDNVTAYNMDDTIRLFAEYFSSVYTTNIVNDYNNHLFNDQLQDFKFKFNYYLRT